MERRKRFFQKFFNFIQLTEKIIHLDLLRIKENTKVTVEVPVEFLNQDICVGLKKGGVLNVIRRTIELICNA